MAEKVVYDASGIGRLMREKVDGDGKFVIEVADPDVSGDGAAAATLSDNFGAKADAAATTNTGTFSFMAFVKRITGMLGATDETAAASDTATSGINGLLKRIAQSLTSLIALQSDPPLVYVTPTLDTNAYAVGDVLFDSTVVTNLLPANDRTALHQTLYLIDKSDQKPALKIYFFNQNVSLGTVNSLPSISDANAAAGFMGIEIIGTNDWDDIGGVNVAQIKNIGRNIKPATGTRNIYVAGITNSAFTFAADSIVLGIGVV